MVGIQHLVVCNRLARVAGHAPHGGDYGGGDSALAFVVLLVVPNGFEKVVPLILIGIALGNASSTFTSAKHPGNVAVWALAFVDACLRSMTAWAGDECIALGSMGMAGEFALAAWHVATVEVELGLVGEGVLDGVVVEVLVDIFPAVVASTLALCLDWPCVLHPAAFVNIMDEEVAVGAARQPEKAVEATYLVEQFGFACGFLAGEAGGNGLLHTVGS